jgi:hypothetical protein
LHAASVFNFDSDSQGLSTPFTNVNNGVAATFTSDGDPGGLEVFQGFFSSLSGNVLLDPGPAGSDGLTLTVMFNAELSSVALDFAINSLSPSDTFNLSAYQGSKLVGSNTESGSVPAQFFYPEGVASFTGAPFNSIVLSSTGLDFAVDDIAVATPEPATVGVVSLVSLFGLVAYRRKPIRDPR